MQKCKSCGAEILFIRMKTGRSMPCNPRALQYRPDPSGSISLVTPDGNIKRGEPDSTSGYLGYISHFATCPNASEHRRRAAD